MVEDTKSPSKFALAAISLVKDTCAPTTSVPNPVQSNIEKQKLETDISRDTNTDQKLKNMMIRSNE